jgi:GNAT superfamily N-acetyltransferase
MLTRFGSSSAMRVGTWLAAWARRDPKNPHTHLGPIGVDPAAQGKGVGQRLMHEYCDELDRTGAAGYLETDRMENVRFYRRFGFNMTDEIDVLGVRNYLMWREKRRLT